MSRPPRGSTPPSSVLQVMLQDLRALIGWFIGQVETIANVVFETTHHGASVRRNFLLVIVILSWSGSALLTHPVRWGDWATQPLNIPIDIAAAYFAAEVLRHVIVIALGFWLSFRIAAIYLDDVFELGDVSVAQSYILQTAFARQYNVISIRDGQIGAESVNSPIYRIGGPGVVLTHLENAALFEKVNGQPHVIGPHRGSPILDGFERLRQVIDLRDQVIDMTVTGRTQDGIYVTARDVRLIFSIARGEPAPGQDGGFSQPYPYRELAIHNLVYRQPPGSWTLAMRNLIRAELEHFIAQHTLSEFLANISPDEISELLRGTTRDQAEPDGDPSQEPDPGMPASERHQTEDTPDHEFIPRDEITDLFYDFTTGFAQKAEDLGVELHWIGVGTWVTPSEIIPGQHLEAWRLSYMNQILGNEAALWNIRLEARSKELLRLIREMPLLSFGRLQTFNLPADDIKKQLILAYRERLRNAWEAYQNNGVPAPDDLVDTLAHLTRMSARWLN